MSLETRNNCSLAENIRYDGTLPKFLAAILRHQFDLVDGDASQLGGVTEFFYFDPKKILAQTEATNNLVIDCLKRRYRGECGPDSSCSGKTLTNQDIEKLL